MNKNNQILQLAKQISIILIFLAAFSSASYAISPHPAWLQESLEKADKLNDKNPVLALEFTQALFNKHNDKLSDNGKAALFARLA